MDMQKGDYVKIVIGVEGIIIKKISIT